MSAFDGPRADFLATYLVDVTSGEFSRIADPSTDGLILVPSFVSSGSSVVAAGTICPSGRKESTDLGPSCVGGSAAVGVWRYDALEDRWAEVTRLEVDEVDAALDEHIITTRLVGAAHERAVLQVDPIDASEQSVLAFINVRTGTWTQQRIPLLTSAECVSESGKVALATSERGDLDEREPSPPVHRLALTQEGGGVDDLLELPPEWDLACSPSTIGVISASEWIDVRFDGSTASKTPLPSSMRPGNRRYTDHVLGSGTPNSGLLREFERIEEHHISVAIVAPPGGDAISHELGWDDARIVVVDTATLLPDGSVAALVSRIPAMGDEPAPQVELLVAS